MRFALRPLAILCALFLAAPPAFAQSSALDGTFGAVMRLKTFVPAEARTAATLGREREGTAILIDGSGLLLTIGYLMVEASGGEVRFPDGRTVHAQVVGYDHDTGLGLMRAAEPPRGVKPLAIGRSSDIKARDPVVIAAFGGPEAAAPAFVVSRRTFAGNWEYMLDSAIWTSPPHPAWSGAALLDTDGKLVGVGSLIVNNATGGETPMPGNVFVPIDALAPILADLIDDGKSSGPVRPWLGMTVEAVQGRLFVVRVTPDGPAEKAGIRRGDMIAAVKGTRPDTLDELFRALWAQGPAGATLEFDLLRDGEVKKMAVPSADRRAHLKLRSSL
ncbi:MAG: serine protease [Rhodospirillales bacterium]|nr:serine protease [Rhodospirillales bacterium]